MKKSTVGSFNYNTAAAAKLKEELKLKKEILSFKNYYSEGIKLTKSQPLKAIDYINNALKNAHSDLNKKKALQVRAYCYLLVGKINEALVDASKAISYDQNDPQSILLKAEALYYKGEFEWALIYFHRGKGVRKNMQNFELGINKCRKAIEKALKESTNKLKLTDLDDDDDVESIEDEVRQNLIQKQDTVDCNKENKRIEMKLLGELYSDYSYLDEIDSKIVQKDEFNVKIKEICNNGLEYLQTRLEFLRQQE